MTQTGFSESMMGCGGDSSEAVKGAPMYSIG